MGESADDGGPALPHVPLLQDALATRPAEVKPTWRGWIHAGTFPLAIVLGIILIVLADGVAAKISSAIFVLSSMLLFGTSALYHRFNWQPRTKTLLKRFDHANIFLLIAGSYTPFGVLALSGDTRVAVLSAVWGTAVLGVGFRVFWVEAPRWLYVALYLGLGWAAGFFVPQLIHGAGVPAFVLVAVGGMLYTLGGVVYGLKRPNPSPKWFGFHEIFHACTVAAFACQYIAASFVVYRAA
jgi:hemolysin III